MNHFQSPHLFWTSWPFSTVQSTFFNEAELHGRWRTINARPYPAASLSVHFSVERWIEQCPGTIDHFILPVFLSDTLASLEFDQLKETNR
jgi:hypothetical protein